MDELATIAEAYSPDLICIVESWLSDDIPNAEVSLFGYHLCRLDRNRHGGGVVVYTRDIFQFTQLPQPDSDLELLTLILQHNTVPTRFCISVFYRPPSSTSSLLDDLSEYLESINSAQFKNFIIIGDFNIDISSSSHPMNNKLCSVMSTHSLSQMVHDYTHIHHNGTRSIIDLLFVSNQSLIDTCSTIPALSNSDHLGLMANLSFKSTCRNPKGRVVWRYSHANWERACNLIEATDWSALLDPTDINLSWTNWSKAFLSIMEKCIPKATLPQRKNRPWLSKKLLQAMRRRNMYYKRAKASRDFSKYKTQRNKVTTMLKEAKKEFFMKINPRNPKEFWKACKMLSRSSTSIPALQMNGNVAKSNDEKAELLNTFFASCFNNSHSPLADEDFLNIECSDSFPEDFLCSEDQILDMLASLDVTKSNGPDNISARMLKATATSLAPSVAALFNLSLQLGRIPQAWKRSRVVPIPKVTAPKSPDNYRPISLLSLLSKVLERHVYNLIGSHLEANPLTDSQ